MFIGLFGFIKTLYIVVTAIVIAVTTGFIYQWLEIQGWTDKNPHTLFVDKEFSIKEDWKRRFQSYPWTADQLNKDARGITEGAVSLSNMVLWWILIGTGLASLIGAYVPENFFHKFMGPTVSGMMVTLLIATVFEVCSEGTAPLAYEVFRQTGALGNSFVFLMAGVVTDYTEIGLIWHNIGRRSALWLPVVTVPQVIFWGILANKIF